MTPPARYRSRDMAAIAQRARAMGNPGAVSLERLLPLGDAAYVVLLALSAPDAAERDVVEGLAAEERAWRVEPGMLAAAVHDLLGHGLLEMSREEQGERYRVTPLGEVVLHAESGRRRRRYDLPVMPKLEALVTS